MVATLSRSVDPELLTVGDAAAILGLSVQMVRVLHGQGKLAASVTPRGYRLFSRADVEGLVRARAQKARRRKDASGNES